MCTDCRDKGMYWREIYAKEGIVEMAEVYCECETGQDKAYADERSKEAQCE